MPELFGIEEALRRPEARKRVEVAGRLLVRHAAAGNGFLAYIDGYSLEDLIHAALPDVPAGGEFWRHKGQVRLIVEPIGPGEEGKDAGPEQA